ncbi:HD-GYP domain-containing protein [Vallitalea pronyensis]|uniref:HD-GYP domain-containing protein n=1 Tax=Vallitalea pronyensis TaxID=1348613 RepID=A0A8J8MKE3_9FIRM|nr:HD-GYP domain-containing protein [Vallitalea pronyensis]QUI22853.1 HD-GYP domain-containing protein [Vallitalea pronyensis]
MRFVPVSSLAEGMYVGKSLYDKNNQLLLGKGSMIQKSYINKISALGYQGIYVDDEISSDIEVKDIICDELRRNTISTIKDVFIKTGNANPKGIDTGIDETKYLIMNIVDQILENEDTIVNLIDLKMFDDYTFYHCVNVAVLSILLGTSLHLNKNQLLDLGLGAILHDIGKMFVDTNVLNKEGSLTKEEYKHIQMHSEYGYRYLKETFAIPSAAYIAVLQHHEKFDGTGYPHRKGKDDISLYGRIIGITDVYDALTSTRPYRKALLPSEAMEYIMANGGVMFDLNLTRKFVQKVAPFPVGTWVQLSNCYQGIVVENYEEACLRPKIKVLLDEKNNKVDPHYWNLKDERNLRNVTITSVHEEKTG